MTIENICRSAVHLPLLKYEIAHRIALQHITQHLLYFFSSCFPSLPFSDPRPYPLLHTTLTSSYQTGPIWARLTGFPYWPARHCSAYEEQCLRAKKNPKAGSASVAVSFLGTSINSPTQQHNISETLQIVIYMIADNSFFVIFSSRSVLLRLISMICFP